MKPDLRSPWDHYACIQANAIFAAGSGAGLDIKKFESVDASLDAILTFIESGDGTSGGNERLDQAIEKASQTAMRAYRRRKSILQRHGRHLQPSGLGNPEALVITRDLIGRISSNVTDSDYQILIEAALGKAMSDISSDLSVGTLRTRLSRLRKKLTERGLSLGPSPASRDAERSLH
ncbi:hypothetical protein LCGC14_0801370 [marine sediment metagenome]|uniref:Uncharacterized protein n=1 Tax=marine sediment metagenome TaxID=412755 RepID=A0A0F9S9I4_9ZZZZ